MKNLILAVFAMILFSTMAQAEQAVTQTVALRPVAEMKPVYRTVKRGDRLWDYVKQYNLNHPKDIVEFNKGKPSAKCIKNENLILQKCKIAIPVYSVFEVQTQQVFNEAAVKTEIKKAENKQTSTHYPYSALFIFVLTAVSIMLIFTILARNAMALKVQKKEKEKSELQKQLWEVADQKEDINKKLTQVCTDLSLAKHGIGLREEEIKKTKTRIAELEASPLIARFKARSGHMLEFDVVKVKCRYLDCNTEVSPQNALSHYFQQHETEIPAEKHTDCDLSSGPLPDDGAKR